MLETNSIPGMTDRSLLPDAAHHAGIEFSELCTRFVQWALEDVPSVKFSFIHNESAAMQLQQILGGHVNAGFMSSGEASGYLKELL